MVEESRDAFTKRLLGKKHISSIMCDPGEPCPSLSPTPRAPLPMSKAVQSACVVYNSAEITVY